MVAAARTAAAAEATVASLHLYIVDRECRRLEACDTRRRAAARLLLRGHLTLRVLTASACLGPKARKHDNPFGRLTNGFNDGKGLRKVSRFLVLLMFRHCFGFLTSVIRRFRILLLGKTTNRPSGSQWCPILTPTWHVVTDCHN